MPTVVCDTCSGMGVLAISTPCRRCNGTGELLVYESDGSEHMETCPNCDFGLVFIEQTCSSCNGSGQIEL